MLRHALLLVVVALVVGCPRAGDPHPAPDPSAAPTSTTSKVPPAPVDSAPEVDPLGPVELTCTVDADCVAHELHYSKADGGCCQSCSNWVANTTWYARAQKRCQGPIGFGKDCPMKKCAPPRPVACVSGQCAFAP